MIFGEIVLKPEFTSTTFPIIAVTF